MTARYQPCGLVLLRSTTDPGDIDIPAGLNPGNQDAVGTEDLEWLAKTWQRGEVRDAITVASPDLATRIGHLLDQPGTAEPRDTRRAVLATACYLRRWQRRVTPFGLFAGIMPAALGPASGTIAATYQAVARADAGWITAITQALGRDSELRPCLTVIASNLAIIRDGRILVPRRAEAGSAAPGPLREASVRWTRPVQAAIEIAATPVQVQVLAGKLAEQFPTATPDQAGALVDGLIDEGFLITGLHAPMTATDPLAHLLAELRAAGAGDIPGVAPLLRNLEDIHGLLTEHNTCTQQAAAGAIRETIATRMTRLAHHPGYPLMIDVRLNGHVSIPGNVLDEASAAADVLLRLTTRPFGSPSWVDYHARFRERYGPAAIVPVQDLVADSGLGYPDGYLGAPPQRPAWRMLTGRDAALLTLIQQVTLNGAKEISLTDTDIQALTTGSHDDLTPPQHAEIGVSLHAESAAAIDRGNFQLRLTAVPRVPTSMAGRFAYLLTDTERNQLDAAYRAGDDDPLIAEVSFPPRTPHNENVTRAGPLTSHVLPLGEHPPTGTPAITVDDLAVIADAAELHLIHRPTGRRVIPRIPHALDLATHTPPLARFIVEVADARTAVLGPFDLGAARALPYVPRIRYRRTILSPARWLLASKDIRASHGEPWDDRLASWRQRWKVPARVIFCAGELRLPLDLDHALDRALLQVHLERAGQAELREDAPPEGNGWLGRPAELLIPLTLTTPAPRPLPAAEPPGIIHRPGQSPVISARITGNPARFDDIISHLPEMAIRLAGVTERWWLRRYRDMIHLSSPQHITMIARLRDPREYAAAAAELAAFAAELEARGLPANLTLTSYTEHPGRYGHGAAMTAAENVFATDTAAAIAQIAMVTAAGIPGQALAAASMTRLAAAFAATPPSGYRVLTRRLEQGSGPLDRAIRHQACQLADSAGCLETLRALPGGDAVADAWDRRDAALARYYEALSAQRDPATVLRTLLHEHHMRALGLDPGFERQTGRYARAAALQRLALAGRL